MQFKLLKSGIIEKIYGPGSVFYNPVMNIYYEIVSGKIKTEIIFGINCIHKKPIRLTVQQLKFFKNKIEFVPIDNFKNREFYEEDHYILVKDDTKKPFLYKHDIYFDTFYKKNSIKKIVSHKPEGEHHEIIREQDK